MARGGLYKTDIQKARQSLLAQGKHPSVDAIRIALGNTGSKSTIHRYLKELEAEDGGAGAKVAISESLQDLVSRLASRLHEEADERIAEAQAACKAQVQERNDALERTKQDAAALAAQLQRTERQLAEERDRLSVATQALHAAEVAAAAQGERVAGQTARLAELEGHVISLEQKHGQARDALEHFRTATKEQRDQEHRRHEAQVQGLQAELRAAAEALTAKNHELLTVNRDAARLTEQVSALQKAAQQAQADARQREAELGELRSMRDEHTALKARWVEAGVAHEAMQAELQAARTALAEERRGRSDAEARAAAADAGRAAVEQLFNRFERLAEAPVPSSSEKRS
jgi:chromosome segregation ATPase